MKLLNGFMKSLIDTSLVFLALITVEAMALTPQGWLLIGVVRHVLSWGILWPFLLLVFITLFCSNLIREAV